MQERPETQEPANKAVHSGLQGEVHLCMLYVL